MARQTGPTAGGGPLAPKQPAPQARPLGPTATVGPFPLGLQALRLRSPPFEPGPHHWPPSRPRAYHHNRTDPALDPALHCTPRPTATDRHQAGRTNDSRAIGQGGPPWPDRRAQQPGAGHWLRNNLRHRPAPWARRPPWALSPGPLALYITTGPGLPAACGDQANLTAPHRFGLRAVAQGGPPWPDRRAQQPGAGHWLRNNLRHRPAP